MIRFLLILDIFVADLLGFCHPDASDEINDLVKS